MDKTTLSTVLLALALCAGSVRADQPYTGPILDGLTNALGMLEQARVDVDPAQARKAVIEAVLRSADPSARVLSGEEMKHLQEEDSGRDFGLGVRLSTTNGRPVIVAVETNSPAARAGLATGQRILMIDGKDTAAMTFPATLQALRGHAADEKSLAVQDAKGTNQVKATLELLPLPAIEVAEVLPGGICYVKLNGLFADAGLQVTTLLRGWLEEGRTGLILDLRGALGGDRASVAQISELFTVPEATLYTFRDTTGQEIEVVKAATGSPLNIPAMVVTDEQTRGAAELLAAVLSGSVRGAMLVGRATAGDPLIRDFAPLSTGDFARMTVRHLVTADGAMFNGRAGITPDVVVAHDLVTAKEYKPEPASSRKVTLDQEITDRNLHERIGKDAMLQRSVDILQGLRALNIKGFSPTSMAK